MSKCVVEGCGEPTPNTAVPACRDHLCTNCMMGVVTKKQFDTQWCQQCLDMKRIHDALGWDLATTNHDMATSSCNKPRCNKKALTGG